MSTLLILLVLAVAVYAAFGLVSSRPRARTGESVAEFHRALEALDPNRRRPRRPGRRPPASASRPPTSRRAA